MRFEITFPHYRRWRTKIVLIVIGVTTLACIGYSHLGANITPNQTRIELQIGEKSELFVRRANSLASIDRQPAGLNFYTMRWPVSVMGTVDIKQGGRSLHVANVISVTATEDTDYIEEGLSEINIYSTITKSEKISTMRRGSRRFHSYTAFLIWVGKLLLLEASLDFEGKI